MKIYKYLVTTFITIAVIFTTVTMNVFASSLDNNIIQTDISNVIDDRRGGLDKYNSNAWYGVYLSRKSFTIAGTADGTQSYYQMKLTIYKSTGVDGNGVVYLGTSVKSDFSDIRFTKADGITPLDYWIETYTSNVSAVVWIEFDSLPVAPAVTTFYIYYNCDSAVSLSSGNNTFVFFDDFLGSALDLDNWYTNGSAYVSAGDLSVYPNVGASRNVTSKIGSASNITAARSYMKFVVSFASFRLGDVGWSQHGGATLSSGTAKISSADPVASTVSSNFSINSWKTIDILVNGGVNTRVFENDVELLGSPKTTNSPNVTDMRVIFEASVTTGLRVQASWVLIRNYTINEPTWGTWGIEEAAPLVLQGSGTEADPYLIHNVNELQALNTSYGAYYELVNDIDASATSSWDGGQGFLPIGSSNGTGADFTGYLYGNGYTISNLQINRPDTDEVGLFGYFTGDVYDLHLTSVNITGRDYVGGFAGKASSHPWNGQIIQNCSTTGEVTGNVTGGLIGQISNYYSETWGNGQSFWIQDNWSSCNVTSINSTAGGFIGEVNRIKSVSNPGYDSVGWLTILNCYATGNVTAPTLAGGFAGKFTFAESGNLSFEKCYSSGNVTVPVGTGLAAGFIAEYYGDAYNTLKDCYSDSSVTGDGGVGDWTSPVGGFLAYTTGNMTIENCYSIGSIFPTGGPDVGGFVGDEGDFPPIYTSSYWDTEASGIASSVNGTGKTTAEMKVQGTFVDWNFWNIWNINPAQNNGYPYLRNTTLDTPVSGVIGNPYIITNVSELQLMNDDKEAYYSIANDIDCSNFLWIPVGDPDTGYFAGNLDGQSYNISNIYVNDNNLNNSIGLFGEIDSATIQNVNTINMTLVGGHAGLLALDAYGTSVISNCSTSGSIISDTGDDTEIAGFIGYVDSTVTITNSTSNCDIFSYTTSGNDTTVGGFIADSSETPIIINCHSSGNITVMGRATIGGFIGYSSDQEQFIDCSADVDIYYTDNSTSELRGDIGGFAGYSCYQEIYSGCYATGDITVYGTNALGNQYGAGVGGFLSFSCDTEQFIGCYSTGDIVYTMETINGNVHGPSTAGGFVGFTSADEQYSQCFSTSNITYNNNAVGNNVSWNATTVGGFGGWGNTDGGNITDCYAMGNISANTTEDSYAGGFFGEVEGMFLTNCYSTGTVTSTTNVTNYYVNIISGFTSYFRSNNWGDPSIIISSYWDTESSGVATGDYGTGKTTTEMKTQSTFVDWTFGPVWGIDSTINQGYPFLPVTIILDGDGTADSPYLAHNVWELQAMQNDPVAYYEIVNDFDCALSTGWENGLGFRPIVTDYSRRPNVDGPVSGNWSGFPGYVDTYFNEIDEVNPDGDTTFISSSSGNITFKMTDFDIPANATNINVGVVGTYRKEVSNGVTKNIVTINGTYYPWGSWQSVTNTVYSTGVINGYRTTNPATGVAWTVNDVNNYLDGFGVFVDTATVRFTQLWMVIKFTYGATPTFDGKGYTISNFYVDRDVVADYNYNGCAWDGGGVFAWRGGGDIKNMDLESVNITGAGIGSGALASWVGGGVETLSFDNITVSGNIWGSDWDIGGLFSTIRSYTTATERVIVSNCTADIIIYNEMASGSTGGLAASTINVDFIDCSSSGTVEALGDHGTGGIVGTLDSGDMLNCSSSAAVHVNGNGYAGGLVGYSISLGGYSIENSYATGNVTVDNVPHGSQTGGLIGYNDHDIIDCFATGNVTDIGDYVGGLIGENYGTVTNSYYIGTVNGNDYVGGLIGGNYADTTRCYAIADVYGANYVGGLLGYTEFSVTENCTSSGVVSATADNAGGLIGNSLFGSTQNSSSSVNVSSSGNYVGGFTGNAVETNITISYSTGNVTGRGTVGGFIGVKSFMDGSSVLENCYSRGDVVGNGSNIGGFVGNMSNNMTNVYSTGLVMASNVTLANNIDSDPDWVSIASRNLAKASDGQLWVTYNKNDLRVYCANSTDNGTTWTTTVLGNASASLDGSIAIDSNDYVHVVWNDSGNHSINYQRYTDSWQPMVVLFQADHPRPVDWPSIAVDGSDDIHVTWQRTRSLATADEDIGYVHTSSNGTVWEVVEYIGILGVDQQRYPVLAVDSINNLKVAWHSGTKILYRERLAGVWQAGETVADGGVGTAQYYASIALDSSDNPHITWRGTGWGTNNTTQNIEYATKTVGWSAIENITDDPEAQGGPSIYITTDGITHIVWAMPNIPHVHPIVYNIAHREYSGGIWQPVNIISDTIEVNGYDSVVTSMWANYPIISGNHTNIPDVTTLVWILYNPTDSTCVLQYFPAEPIATISYGLVGYAADGFEVTSCYWDVETSGTIVSMNGTGKTTIEMKTQATFIGWDFTILPIWYISPLINDGYPAFINGPAPPTVISIVPNFGPDTGGTFVVITGTNFVNGATVQIESFAINVVWINDSSITAITSAATAGVKDVTVTNPNTLSGTLVAGFTYTSIVPPPTPPDSENGTYFYGLPIYVEWFNIHYPNSVGTYSAWEGAYTNIDDYWRSFDDSNAIFTTSDNASDSFKFTQWEGYAEMSSVTVVIRAKRIYTDDDIQLFYREDGINFILDILTPTGSYTDLSKTYSKNPATGNSWNITSINGMEWGLIKTGVAGNVYVSQMYIKVIPSTIEGQSSLSNLGLKTVDNDLNITNLIADGYVDSNFLYTGLYNAEAYFPQDVALYFRIANIVAYETKVLQLKLTYSPPKDYFWLIPVESGNITIPDAALLEPGNTFNLSICGYLDTSAGATKYLINKPGSIQIYVADTGNLTALMYGALANLQISTDNVTTGVHTVNATADGVNFSLYVDDAMVATAVIPPAVGGATDTADDWLVSQNDSMSYMDFVRFITQGVENLFFQPITITGANDIIDRDGGNNNGSYNYGHTPSGITVWVGVMQLMEDFYNDPLGSDLYPNMFVGPPDSQTGRNAEAAQIEEEMKQLPLYVVFHNAADSMGLPTSAMYALFYIAYAMGIGFLVYIISGVIIAGLGGVMLILALGISANVLPLWFLIVFIIASFALIYIRNRL